MHLAKQGRRIAISFYELKLSFSQFVIQDKYEKNTAEFRCQSDGNSLILHRLSFYLSGMITKRQTILVTIRTSKMKKSFLFFLTAFLAVTIFFVGCKKSDSNPTDSNGTPQTTTGPNQPMPTFSGTVDGVVIAFQFTYTDPNVPAPYNSFSVDMGYAKFGEISGTGTDAGTVTLNSKNIAKTTTNDYNSFTSFTPLDLNWDGNPHHWSVSGAGSTPAFTIDVTSPTAFIVSYPTESTVASKSSNMNVTWSNYSNASTDSVLIVLSAGSSTFTATTSNITGSYSIPSSQLNSMSGNAILQVAKYKYTLKTVSSKNFVGVAEIVKMVNFKIQ